jgi:3-isopropylmalate/(R)-2-methylmalate dehydratase small subunit
MAQFTRLTSRVIPLLADNIDTDQIIPARFLKATDKKGLGNHVFADWRYNDDGFPRPEFVLNHEHHRGARILLAGDNFGCGSSREHAPWALMDFGLQAVISTSFADIFRGNALKNGLLPVSVTPEGHNSLREMLARNPSSEITIDLASQLAILSDGQRLSFPIDGFSKTCLLNGVDELGYLLGFMDRVQKYEASHV